MRLIYSHFHIPENCPYRKPIKGLQGCGVSYRFSFNGKENDNETYGEGNALDFGARIYDARLGRWLSLDPFQAKYPSLSPYNFVANSPNIFIDPDGKKIVYIIRNDQGQIIKKLTYKNGNFWHEDGSRYNPSKERLSINLYLVLEAYRKIESSGDKELIKQLRTIETSPKLHTIEEQKTKGGGSFVRKFEGDKDVTQENKMVKEGKPIGTHTVFDFSPESSEAFNEQNDGIGDNHFTTVTHELQHQYDYDQGNMKDNSDENNAKDPSEIRGVKNENRMRIRLGMKIRTKYGGEKIDSKKL